MVTGAAVWRRLVVKSPHRTHMTFGGRVNPTVTCGAPDRGSPGVGGAIHRKYGEYMTTDQVNPSPDTTDLAVVSEQSPAETAYQALQQAQADNDRQQPATEQPQLPIDADSVDEVPEDDRDDPFTVFSAASATSLLFHAPDTETIKAAAERAAQAREEARQAAVEEAEVAEEAECEDPAPGMGVTSKRRRRRRRGSVDMELEGGNDDDPPGTITRIRTGRVIDTSAPSTVQSVKGSTRLEAKKQRRRESRQSGRRRQVVTEAEFLARRESVERKMVVRQKDNRIQIGVLEDGVLAEHFVSHTQQDSLIGNVYLGKVQNVLPSMEAAFVDIGRGRNAVLYAGEVNWDDADLGGGAKRIENALKPGDSVIVQVTKDPVGHKGARLTSQVSLPGRYLVYVPGGSMTGISRKLPDVERQRLKKILKDNLPEDAGVIVRTAAEGASEEELTHDINRLRSQWEQIQEKSRQGKTLAPEMLYVEPDLTIKTVRDVFNEDFVSMVVQGQDAWDSIEAYVTYVAPDLLDRVSQWSQDEDLFEHYQVDEQIYKALDRKVMLPSGGSLVIDRTEAMTVVDVNTGKFTGSGGNLEETVTKNNLEAAEEIVRQLRLRDIGGIIVIDFIDMVLEANRDLVLRRLVECLGRDRTKHQVAEVTSLGLVQMTRKRMGTGLLEIFSEPCEACDARGVVIHDHPLKGKAVGSSESTRRDRNERKRNRRSSNAHVDELNVPAPTQEQPESHGVEDVEQARRAEATRHAFAAIASASQQTEPQPQPKDVSAADSVSSVVELDDSGAEHVSDDPDAAKAHEGIKRRRKRRGRRSVSRPPGNVQTPEGTPEISGELDDQHVVTVESAETQQQSPRRGRGVRRAVAPVGTPESTPESQVTIKGHVIELPQATERSKFAAATDVPAANVPSLDVLADAMGERGPQKPSVRRPRRSRRASAPVAAPKEEQQ